jgi:hypothetical protein
MSWKLSFSVSFLRNSSLCLTETEKMSAKYEQLKSEKVYDQLLKELSFGKEEHVMDQTHEQYREAVTKNPHIAQVATYKTDKKTDHDIHVVPLSSLQRVLLPTAPTAPYRRRADEKKTVNHWGQRKLLLSEIEFLTMFAESNDTVVYAGAAPGTHTEFLASLFPTLKFVLVDPAEFVAPHRPPQIEVRKAFFTDDTAREFAGRNDVLFVCDVRSADWKVMNQEEVEDSVEKDQVAQMKWHILMKPRASMLKFRLPWGKGSTDYLDGRILLPIWGPQTTTESRLVVLKDATIRSYDHENYEARMFRFNVIDRVHLYARTSGLVECRGLDRCYDCSAELLVVLAYFCKYRIPSGELNRPKLWGEITDFIVSMARRCSPQSTRELWSVVDSEHRRVQWFGGRRFDSENQKIVEIDTATTLRGVEEKKRNRDQFERQERSMTAAKLSSDPVLASALVDSAKKRVAIASRVAPTSDEEYAALLEEFKNQK